MTKSEKLEALSRAYISKKVDDAREQITVLNDESPVHEDVKAIQFRLNEETGTFELDYQIMQSACYALSNLEQNQLDSADANELANDTASIWTSDEIGYINMHNQIDIADIVHEQECDIATAAAVWYERQVSSAIQMLLDWLSEPA